MNFSKTDLKDKQFSVLKKCRSKFECLIFEMLFIKELNPELNTQKDYIRAKLFTDPLRDSACKCYFLLLYTYLLGILLTFIFATNLITFDLIMTLRKRLNVVTFLKFFNQDGFKFFTFIAMFYS